MTLTSKYLVRKGHSALLAVKFVTLALALIFHYLLAKQLTVE